MGVVRRVAELGGDPLLQLLGEDVLEHLGLGVDPVPRHAKVDGQVGLQEPVVAQDLHRHPHAVGRQAHPVVGDVGDEAHPVQPLDHRRGRRRGHPEALGQRVGGDAPLGLLGPALERVDRLGVVLDGGGDGGVDGCHETKFSHVTT